MHVDRYFLEGGEVKKHIIFTQGHFNLPNLEIDNRGKRGALENDLASRIKDAEYIVDQDLKFESLIFLSTLSFWIRPIDGFKPFTWYEIQIYSGAFTTLDKTPLLHEPLIFRWRTSALLADLKLTAPSTHSIQTIFQKKCSCHQVEENQLIPLDIKSLINQPSQRDPNYQLITPKKPELSALFLSILRDYPINGAPMPPLTRKRLSQTELEQIEQWILSL